MKNIKSLIELVKGSLKLQIISGSVVVGIVGVSVVAGISMYSNNDDLTAGTTPMSERPVQQEIKETDKEKSDKEKNGKIVQLTKNIKEINKDFALEDVSKKTIDEQLAYYEKTYKTLNYEANKKLSEEDKKKAESKGEVSPGDGVVNSVGSSGSETSSTQPSSGGNSSGINPPVVTTPIPTPPASDPIPTPPAPEPVPEPEPVPVPSTPSGWKDDIANQVISMAGNPNKPGGNGNYSAEQWSTMNSMVDGWFNGSGISMGSINQTMFDSFIEETDFPIQLNTLTIVSVSGLNADSIYNACINSNMKSFLFVKVYYDAITDISTVHVAGGNV